MANNDQAAYNLRYNEITGDLEAKIGLNWVTLTIANASGGITQLTGQVTAGPGSGSQVATVATTAAVKSIHADASSNLTGAVQLVSGTNVTLSQVGQAITINSSGGGGSPNIVFVSDTADYATSSATPVSTGVTGTITASSNSAHIKITVSGCLRAQNASASGANLYLYKDGTPVTARSSILENSGGGDTQLGFSFVWVDVPGDTSPHVYTIFLANDDASTPVHLYGPGATTALVLEEVH